MIGEEEEYLEKGMKNDIVEKYEWWRLIGKGENVVRSLVDSPPYINYGEWWDAIFYGITLCRKH